MIKYQCSIKEDITKHMTYNSKDFSYLLGLPGFSDQLMQNHFKLYEGYVANTNKVVEGITARDNAGETGTPEFAELKRRLGWEFNGMRLHELYFENLNKDAKTLDPESDLAKKLIEQYGSIKAWQKYFTATGSLRGIGWVVMYWEPVAKKFLVMWINEHDVGHPAGCVPLLVMDVFEHAFMIDYGLARADYIDAFMKAVDWGIINQRYININ